MDWETSFIGIMLIVLCMIPVLLIIRSNKKRKRKLIQDFLSLVEKSNSKISFYDQWAQSIIGIDDSKGFLFYQKIHEKHKMNECINISELKNCQVIKKGRIVQNGLGKLHVTDNIELSCTFPDNIKKSVNIEFYNALTDSLTVSVELVLAEKWEKLINDRISLRGN